MDAFKDVFQFNLKIMEFQLAMVDQQASQPILPLQSYEKVLLGKMREDKHP